MSAAETIAAAIEKLEELRDRNVEVQGEWLVEFVGEHTCGGYGEGSGWLHEPGCGTVPLTTDPLIVTLHRTIDVNLGWLTREHMLATEVEGYVPFAYTVALARAILGDPS